MQLVESYVVFHEMCLADIHSFQLISSQPCFQIEITQGGPQDCNMEYSTTFHVNIYTL